MKNLHSPMKTMQHQQTKNYILLLMMILMLEETFVGAGAKFTLESPSSEHAQNINEVIKETIDNLFINTLLSPENVYNLL